MQKRYETKLGKGIVSLKKLRVTFLAMINAVLPIFCCFFRKFFEKVIDLYKIYFTFQSRASLLSKVSIRLFSTKLPDLW